MEERLVLTSVGHDVVFGNAQLILAEYFQRHPDKRRIVIADENTFKYCWPKIIRADSKLKSADIIQLDSGEENKNIEVCIQVWNRLKELRVSRNDVIINLGGGVITDLGGFIASTFKRGVSFIQVPTSLLAMVDASIGGKVGVDLAGLKNLIGNFATPDLVVVDVDFLDSLPDIQLKCGFAEVLKHGAALDRDYWNQTIKSTFGDLPHVKSLVQRSVELKNQLVLADFEDRNDRKKLNFGHTVGHALETHFISSKVPLLHGEAVALGMVVEADLGYCLGVTSENCYNHVENMVLGSYTIPDIEPMELQAIVKNMKNDKKNRNGQINFTFLQEIGSCLIDQTASEEQILDSLKKCLSMDRKS